MRRVTIPWALATLACASAFAPVRAEAPKLIHCDLAYTLKGWSAFYKTAKGEGTITCDDGSSMKVRISTKGGGLTFGKSEILDGSGTFSEVKSIDDLLGTYAAAEAHAGAVKGGSAQAMTKGEVSLALAGKGAGVDVGIAFGGFTIKKK